MFDQQSKQLFKYINLARCQPSHFVPIVQQQIASFINQQQISITTDIVYETNEGISAWHEAKRFLQQQKPIPALQMHPGLVEAAQKHAGDLAQHNLFGHTGSDGSTFSERILRNCKKGKGAMAEIIGADFLIQGRNSAQMMVLGLIVDDGISDRGHRNTIFNENYKYVGYAYQTQADKAISVFTITQSNLAQKKEGSALNHTSSSSESAGGLLSQSSQKKSSKPFREVGNSNLQMPRSPRMKGESELRKQEGVKEIRQTNRNWQEQDCKIAEKVIQVYFKDGRMEEKVQRYTVYK